jgi:hypothetical protein
MFQVPVLPRLMVHDRIEEPEIHNPKPATIFNHPPLVTAYAIPFSFFTASVIFGTTSKASPTMP